MKKPSNTFCNETSLERNTSTQNCRTFPAQLPPQIPYFSTGKKIQISRACGHPVIPMNDNKDKYKYNVNLCNFSRHFSKISIENVPVCYPDNYQVVIIHIMAK